MAPSYLSNVLLPLNEIDIERLLCCISLIVVVAKGATVEGPVWRWLDAVLDVQDDAGGGGKGHLFIPEADFLGGYDGGRRVILHRVQE